MANQSKSDTQPTTQSQKTSKSSKKPLIETKQKPIKVIAKKSNKKADSKEKIDDKIYKVNPQTKKISKK